MKVWIGVDAGGSRTTVAVARGDGSIVARAEGGPGRVRPGQAVVSAVAIFGAAKEALQRARVKGQATMLVVGASGVGHRYERDALSVALESSKLAKRLHVTTDADIALESAFGTKPGIIVIAGTGSVAWARQPDGTLVRAGGLGPVLGDRGSGHDLGREALRAVGVDLEIDLHLDLTQRICAHLEIPSEDLPRWSLAADVAAIAALAPVVLDSALSGDTVAQSLAQQGARQLATLVAELADRFPSGHGLEVGWGGGLLANRPDYRALFRKCVSEFVPDAKFSRAPLDAVKGAVAMARRMAH